MSFTISKSQTVNQVDPATGVVIGNSIQEVELTVTVCQVSISKDMSASAGYKTSYGQSESDVSYFNFTYEGGNALTEAESALKSAL